MYQTELSLDGLIGSPSVSEGEGPSCLNRKFRSFLRGKQQSRRGITPLIFVVREVRTTSEERNIESEAADA